MKLDFHRQIFEKCSIQFMNICRVGAGGGGGGRGEKGIKVKKILKNNY